jgi:hypothetical protein
VWSHNSASFSSLSTLSAHTLRRRFNTLSVKREFREGEKEERFVYLLRTLRIITTHTKNRVVLLVKNATLLLFLVRDKNT